MKPLIIALVAGAALAGCASPPQVAPKPDFELAQYISSAQTAFHLAVYDRAARFYELALQRARAMDDSAEIGKQAYNLAASLLLADRPADALPYLTEADAVFARARSDRGSVSLLRARALRALGQADAAQLEIQKTVELPTSREVQCQAWLLYGQLSCDATNIEEATKGLSRARSFLTDEPALRAGVAGLAGRMALLKGEGGDAGLEFDKEAEFMRRATRYRDMAASLQRAGEAYTKAGDMDAAGLRFYRASRSWQGLGETLNALKTMERALAVIGSEDEPGWGPEMSALFSEIKATPVAGTPPEKLE